MDGNKYILYVCQLIYFKSKKHVISLGVHKLCGLILVFCCDISGSSGWRCSNVHDWSHLTVMPQTWKTRRGRCNYAFQISRTSYSGRIFSTVLQCYSIIIHEKVNGVITSIICKSLVSSANSRSQLMWTWAGYWSNNICQCRDGSREKPEFNT